MNKTSSHSLSRRKFIGGISAATLASIYPTSFLQNHERNFGRGKELELIKPPALKIGDKIGIVAPASNAYEHEEIQVAREMAEALGFKVELGENVAKQYGYLAGTDEERAADLNKMLGRDDIRGVFTFQGGYGCCRLLPFIDYESIRKRPKVIIGYSDITSLLLGIHKHAGIVTFHGPTGFDEMGTYAVEHFKRATMSTASLGVIAQPPRRVGVEKENRLLRLVDGRARGRLVGGNLTLVTNSLGTPFEIETKGKILFLEDVGEEPYRVDRMLTQLWLAGKFQEANGIVFGKFTRCTPREYKPAFESTLSIEEILRTRIEPLGKPAIFGMMIGHIKDNATIPLGVEATLDVEAGTLSAEESAVV
jgi:muramoyltetrapeptide carboxypeptidase